MQQIAQELHRIHIAAHLPTPDLGTIDEAVEKIGHLIEDKEPKTKKHK